MIDRRRGAVGKDERFGPYDYPPLTLKEVHLRSVISSRLDTAPLFRARNYRLAVRGRSAQQLFPDWCFPLATIRFLMAPLPRLTN